MLPVRLTSHQQHEQSLQRSLMSLVTKTIASPSPIVSVSGGWGIYIRFLHSMEFVWWQVKLYWCLVNIVQPRKEWICVIVLQVSWCLWKNQVFPLSIIIFRKVGNAGIKGLGRDSKNKYKQIKSLSTNEVRTKDLYGSVWCSTLWTNLSSASWGYLTWFLLVHELTFRLTWFG